MSYRLRMARGGAKRTRSNTRIQPPTPLQLFFILVVMYATLNIRQTESRWRTSPQVPDCGALISMRHAVKPDNHNAKPGSSNQPSLILTYVLACYRHIGTVLLPDSPTIIPSATDSSGQHCKFSRKHLLSGKHHQPRSHQCLLACLTRCSFHQ